MTMENNGWKNYCPVPCNVSHEYPQRECCKDVPDILLHYQNGLKADCLSENGRIHVREASYSAQFDWPTIIIRSSCRRDANYLCKQRTLDHQSPHHSFLVPNLSPYHR